MEAIALASVADAGSDEWKVVAKSFIAPKCPDAHELGVAKGALIGLADSGKITCEGAMLAGATFTIAKVIDDKPRQITITIDDLGQVSTWHKDPKRRELLTSYRFLWPDPEDGEPSPMCPLQTASWMEAWQVGGIGKAGKPRGIAGASWRAQTDHALIVQGETYDDRAEVEHRGPGWFNIACAGAAFAKMRLLGFDPTQDPNAGKVRQATLKMITARYKDEEAYTEQGMPLQWKLSGNVEYYGSPDEERLGPIEALWNANGATCLSHLRVCRQNDYRPGCGTEKLHLPMKPRCTAQAAGAVPAGAVWMTVTVDHMRMHR